MHNSVKFVVLVLLSLACLAACGQKGPLFLPGDPNEIRSTVPLQQPAGQPGESEDDEDDKIPRTYHR